MKTCRVITDCVSAYPDPLILRKGDTLTVGERDDEWPGWIKGTDKSGKTGWIPEVYLKITGDTAEMLRDYNATELTVAAGEVLTVTEEESGWLLCITASGEKGWVPVENVEEIS